MQSGARLAQSTLRSEDQLFLADLTPVDILLQQLEDVYDDIMNNCITRTKYITKNDAGGKKAGEVT